MPPSCDVVIIIFLKSSTVFSNPFAAKEKTIGVSVVLGAEPTSPMEAWVFCDETALTTSWALNPKEVSLSAFNQIRIEYCGPYMETSPIPATRARGFWILV